MCEEKIYKIYNGKKWFLKFMREEDLLAHYKFAINNDWLYVEEISLEEAQYY